MNANLQALIETLSPRERDLAQRVIEALVDFERANRPSRRKPNDRFDERSRAGLEDARRRFLGNVG